MWTEPQLTMTDSCCLANPARPERNMLLHLWLED